MVSSESLIELPKMRRIDAAMGLEDKAQGGDCLAGSRWGPWVWHYPREEEVKVVLQGNLEQLFEQQTLLRTHSPVLHWCQV